MPLAPNFAPRSRAILRHRMHMGWKRLINIVAKRARMRTTASRLGWSGILTPLALLVFGLLLYRQITPQTIPDIQTAFGAFTPLQWAASIFCVWLSFLAIGRNEAVAHDLVDTGIPHKRARRAGMQSVAIAQSLGFSALTAAFARKRAMPELGLWPLARLSVAASMAFWAAFSLLILQVLLFQQSGGVWLPLSATCVALVLARILRPTIGAPGLTRLRMLRSVLWTNLDMFCAALALFVFLPSTDAVTLTTLFTVYLLALTAGLLSQSPGGIGAFELTFLMVLPQIPDGQLLAALVAYRLTYHSLPALIAAACLIKGPKPADATALVPVPLKAIGRTIIRSGQADWGLARQDARILLTRDHASGWLTGNTLTSLTAIGRPLGHPALAELTFHARATGRRPFLYKCSARTATQARRMGWTVRKLSREAVLTPASWSIEGAKRRQLRRKLRQATKAGLTTQFRPKDLPLTEMAYVSTMWTNAHGAERGFSMGRFHPQLVSNQVVMLGYVKDRLVGFVSFHKSRGEWGLDLMRQHPHAPPGTMQTLITATIALARQRGVARVSLAACLDPGLPIPKSLDPGDNAQFKDSFGPKWHPLYIAAPTTASLITGLISTTLAIHLPGPVQNDITAPRPWPRRRTNGPDPKTGIATLDPTCKTQAPATQSTAPSPSKAAAPPWSDPNDQSPDDPA